MSSWVKGVFQAQPSTESGTSSNGSFSRGYFTQKTRIYDFLRLNQHIGATPVLIVPVTLTTADAANLVDYLEDGSGTTPFGAIRVAQGQSGAWVCASGCPFSLIHLELGNENWNNIFLGHALVPHTNNPNNYFDYGFRMGVVLAAARARQAEQGYSTAVTRWDANGQTGSTSDFQWLTAFFCGQPGYSGGEIKCTQGAEDDIELHQYYAINIRTVSTTGCFTPGSTNATCPLYGPSLTENWSNQYDPASASGAEQSFTKIASIKNCGPDHNAACQGATYERAVYPTGTAIFTQAVSDTFTPTGWHGVADAISYAESDHNNESFVDEYGAQAYYISLGGVLLHMYGSMIDAGGDSSVTNTASSGGSYSPRPQMGAAEVFNYCKIGQEVQTTGSSIPTYNLPANSNDVHAIDNVPNLTFHEYASGTKRCLIINNNDIFSSHHVSLAGTNVPSTVTQFQQAPPSPTATNEAPALEPNSTVAATVYPVLTTGVNVASGFTAPPISTTALVWTTGGTPTASTPTASPAAGTYDSEQMVTLSSTGALICWNITGTKIVIGGADSCSAGSEPFTGPISVASTATITAVAGGPGFLDSGILTATYTISITLPPPTLTTPTFTPPAGTYPIAQSVTINLQAGSIGCYTTDGSTPTATTPGTCSHGKQFTAAIPVSTTQTIMAIATEAASVNSSVGSATYTITAGGTTHLKLSGNTKLSGQVIQ
jgi:hypothetical protein